MITIRSYKSAILTMSLADWKPMVAASHGVVDRGSSGLVIFAPPATARVTEGERAESSKMGE